MWENTEYTDVWGNNHKLFFVHQKKSSLFSICLWRVGVCFNEQNVAHWCISLQFHVDFRFWCYTSREWYIEINIPCLVSSDCTSLSHKLFVRSILVNSMNRKQVRHHYLTLNQHGYDWLPWVHHLHNEQTVRVKSVHLSQIIVWNRHLMSTLPCSVKLQMSVFVWSDIRVHLVMWLERYVAVVSTNLACIYS